MAESNDNDDELIIPNDDEPMSGGNPADLLGIGSSQKALKDQVSHLEAELEKAKALAAENEDKMMRAFAEVENVRRKALRDIDNTRKFASESLLKEMVPVIDSLGHALEAAKDIDPAMLEGLLLTEKMLIETLEKFGVIQISPEGEIFDPEWHEALSTQSTTDVAPNTVVAVVQKGYQLNGRVIRPARVIVAKAP